MNRKTKGVFLIILSALGYAIMGTFVKLSGDLPVAEKVFFRNLIGCIVALYIIIKKGDPLFGNKENRPALFLRGIGGTLGAMANFYAIGHLLLPNALMLNQLSPFFLIIFSYLFLKENIKLFQSLSLIVAFIGVLFIIRPSSGMRILPALIGLSSAFFAGMSFTAIRYLGTREKTETIVFFFSFFSVIFTIPLIALHFVPLSMKQIIFLLLAGISTSIAQFALTAAYRYSPAKEISIFSYTQIIFAGLLSLMIWGQVPNRTSLIGYVLVLFAALLIFVYNNKLSKKTII